jgi:predicted CoA-binding protein
MKPNTPHPQEVLALLRNKGPETRIAVVGASNNPEKYGNAIVRNLQQKGYTVLPVNPRENEVAGLPAYASLRDVPAPIHVVDMVVPPPVTLAAMKEAAELKVPAVFLQDGSYDDAVLAYAATAPFKTMYEACIMVVTR